MEKKTMKYFYTDPLFAAWMATHHGIRFTTEYGDDTSFVPPIYFHEPENGESYFGKLYVHPDSLHLLEPTNDDEGVDDSLDQCEHIGGWVKANNCNTIFGKVKIDKRNGIAFMWPESEE